MEELLCKKFYYCKPISGLKMSCKSILGLTIKLQTFFRMRQTLAATAIAPNVKAISEKSGYKLEK